MYRALLIFCCAVYFCTRASAQVVINEIHYHPVELEAFNANGSPVLDLTDDVHEFVELRNTGPAPVDLSGWRLTDGVTFTFPNGSSIPAGGFLVVAKNAARLQTVYGITGVLGPFGGKLSNSGETVRLRNSDGLLIDAVNYSSGFPWAQSAHSLGANASFLGFNLAPYQYKGRSLERVSAAASSNDAANWLASPLQAGPTPGSANAVTRAVPKPVVIAFNVFQESDESPTVRPGQPVRVNAAFSSAASLSGVELQWFIDDINAFNEPIGTIPMQDSGNGQFTVTTAIPGQAARAIVRFRIRANRGEGVEVVSPRADDPQLVPVSATVSEAWHACFVEPVRTVNGRVDYDFFISAAGISVLDNNINQSPRRVLSGTQGYPRDKPFHGYYTENPAAFPQYNPANYPAPGAPHWNGTVPAIFVKDGVVYDIRARYHGSRYQRSAGKNSWKFTFPRMKLLDGVKQRILVTEKGNDNVLGYSLFHAAGLPAAYSQFVDFFKNNENVVTRCEISDNDEEMIKRFQMEETARNPQDPPQFDGDGTVYKSKGLGGDEGPYGWAAGQKIPPRSVWTQLDRYIWSFPIQNSDWRGHVQFRDMLNALWTARGDESRLTYTNSYNGDPTNFVNADALRAYLDANWDKEKILTYLAVRNWMSPWDDKFHNYLVYRQGDGKWTMLPWDFDGEMNGGATGDAGYNNSIFAGKRDDVNGSYSNNSRGPNWFKDSVLRAYEDNVGPNTNNDFRRKLFILNNTLLKPANVQAFAASIGVNVPNVTWLNNRFISVNNQVNLGPWHAPEKPVNTVPASNASVLPGAQLGASAYTHSNSTPPAHAQTRWEIRARDGSYAAPVYNVVSTTNLTSLPIPFELLTFGRGYAWRATYYDDNGHPSDPSDESHFIFGLAPVTGDLVAIGSGSPWRYNQTAAFSYPSPAPAPNDPAWWASTAYNDSAWPSGDPLFGGSTSTALPPNIRTNLTIGRSTYYFRRTFSFSGSPTGAVVRAFRWIDDGCVVFINGVEVPELRRAMPTGAPLYSTQASGTVGTAAQEGPIDVPSHYFVNGVNTIAVEVHQATSGSSDIVFGLGLEADIPQASGDVVINEVLADNRKAVSHAGSYPDYVELYNARTVDVSLDGWSLTDNVLAPNRYAFPAGTMVPAGGYLVVFCDNDFDSPGLHTGFKLSAGGQTVALIEGTTVRDFVTFGPQAPDHAIGRVGAGVGAWALVMPSPETANTGMALGSPSVLKVNEWMANPGAGEDWFEVYNPGQEPVALGGLYLGDNPSAPTITQIPELSFIAARGFARFEADGRDDGANHANFKLGAAGDSLIITAANGLTTIDSVTFGAQALNVSSGRLPDGAGAIVAFVTPTPGKSNFLPAAVVINEALSHSTAPLEDAIELHNPTGSPVDLGGWWLSDDPSDPQKYQIPAGVVIAAGGYKVFYENQFNAGERAFSLSSAGDEIVLSAVDGGGAVTGYRSQVEFGAAAEGVSFGRVLTGDPSGSGVAEFWPLLSRTFGEDLPASVDEFRAGSGLPNVAPRTTPVVINEIMYRPLDFPNSVDNARDEFIELHNITTGAVAVAGWKIRGGSDFTFPAGAAIRPGDYVLIVGFDPDLAPATLDEFRATYGLPESTPVFGPYFSKLANSSQRIELAKPGQAGAGAAPLILVDAVEYADTAPWPTAPDGNGPSLQRRNRLMIGNDVANWGAGIATPGHVNSGQEAILDNDGDGLPNDWEEQHGFDPFNAADALLDSDQDGSGNLEEYLFGTDPGDAADRMQVEVAESSGGAGFVIRFLARAGRSYAIQYKDALSDPAWLPLASISAATESRSIEHLDETSAAQRFYRVTATGP